MTTWVRDFSDISTDISADMLADVGGKAANLGELTRAGLPVPPGFCVTTDAYREVAAAAGADGSHDAATTRALILGTAMPDAISEAITRAYAALGADVPVAVRSSATAEDLPFASFAGQQDTYLNVVGIGDVLDAVRRCWASLWTDRAFAYRATNGIDNRTVRLAVVVQRMVQSEVAGVMFTADPVTGRRHEYVLDASPGLGEAVVSGAVNPDHFVVRDGAIVERRLGDKRVVIRSLPGGGTERLERESGAADACVTDDQVIALAALGAEVERHYGAPQDTEWAIDAEGALWLTQSRPITTLYPLPDQSQEDTRVYFSITVAQGLYRPITPSGLATFRLLATSVAREILGLTVADPVAGPSAFAEIGGRGYIDVTAAVRSEVGRAIVPKVLGVMEARSGAALSSLFDDPRFALRPGSRRKAVLRLLRLAVRFRVPLRVLQAVISPRAAHRFVDSVGRDIRRRIALHPGATPVERLDHVEQVLLRHLFPVVPRVMPSAAAGFLLLGLAGKIVGRPGEVQAVLRGVPHNITTEMDLELWHLATRIRESDAVSQFREESPERLAERYLAGTLPDVGLAEFLEVWGDRAVAEIDVGMPRWSDDPTHILGVLANYLRLADQEAAPDVVFARGTAQARAAIDRLVAQAPRRKRILRFALNRARDLAGIREMPKYFLVIALGSVREHLKAIGAELAEAGRIARPDDVFFLDFKQIRSALGGTDQHERISGNREAYEQELRRRRIPRVMLSDGTDVEAISRPVAAADGSLPGTPASAGSITGTARVVLDPVGAHLEPGEILVAPSTDPGWTPLFLTAGGLVMEMGGANSHGAVVAREYGIPAVVGVADATHRITTGQTITVDGATGVVTPVPA
ncbi:phosphoenolpyruvate synthase [Actinosynnema sp. ALI-1.44]|uniref:PEP/pyruvate-binding domain-containing protein n=1 Tax=Actinosynnema sp. ALI-1.44 TaxID=1933779 RepID=UPI00097C77C4|nr:PEP/pyruvate-binding domain-containing protein [Actinosynnema sp. ALI-1.44]ONI81184.1 phosphoenolpyruvate synthase [Actinosynnema sp. ALI-1.44]